MMRHDVALVKIHHFQLPLIFTRPKTQGKLKQ